MQKRKKNTNDILVFSLGGLGAVGMNMYVVQCLDEIIIMDAGVLFAGGETPGVDYIIPDFTYLIENQDKIKAMFITHGHEDHIGGLPFLLEKVNVPVIYASGIAYNLIKNKMFEYPNISYNLKNYYDDSVFEYNNFTVSFFRTNHSIPDSFGIAIKTRLGYIVNTGDFKFDFTPVGPASDYYKMTKLGHEGVLCLMSDSTNADIKTFYLDIYSTQNFQDFVKLFANTVLGQLDDMPQKALARVGRFLKSCRPVMSFDDSGKPTFSIDVVPSAEEATLKEIFEYLASSEKRCYIAIDEFQQIAEYPEKGVEALLRSYIQFLPNVNFIFAGSKQHVLAEMFTSAKKPFYLSTQLMTISAIEKQEYYDFAQSFFAGQGKELPLDVFSYLYDRYEGHTWYIQCVLNRLFSYLTISH